MSKRYTKLFSLPGNLYAEGAPVIVSAGNLLKDNQTGRVLAQLKIKNFAAKPLKAATVLIHPQDTTGKSMEGDTQQKYLDLSAKTGEEFGQKTAVFLPDASTRGFSVEITQAVFADNSTWEGTDAAWESLPAPESLSRWLGDAELLKQYKLKFGGACEAVPQEHDDLWLCACGAWNKGEKCCACGKDKAALFSLDLAALKAECDARLAEEQARWESDKAAAEAKAKKTKKTLAITIPALAAVLAVILLLTTVVIPNNRYNAAVALQDAGQYEEAITAFEALDGYKDSAERINAAKTAKAEEERLAREAQIEAENAAAYEKAEALLAAGQYDEAIAAFKALGSYRDSAERAESAREAKKNYAYAEAEALLANGKTYEAALAFYRIKDYRDAWARCFDIWDTLTQRETLSAGNCHTVGLRADGSVVAVGSNKYSQCDVGGWTDIVAVAAGGFHSVGLRADGTVLSVGSNLNGQRDADGWTDIVAIAAGDDHTVGLRADGTVVAVGSNFFGQCDVGDWTDIVAVAAGAWHTVGLRTDGTVLATKYSGNVYLGQGDVDDWRDIFAIAAGSFHTVGLRADGTVLAVGNNAADQCDVGGWTDIVAIAAGEDHTVGLRADGTVLAVGSNFFGQCDVGDWTDIVAVAARNYHTVGLRADGTVLAVGNNEYSRCDVSDWRDIKLPD